MELQKIEMRQKCPIHQARFSNNKTDLTTLIISDSLYVYPRDDDALSPFIIYKSRPLQDQSRRHK